MIDAINVSPMVHVIVGALTLITALLALALTGWAAWKKQPFTKTVHAAFILFQLTLMLQALIGVKLLDQGLGPRQLYIHYLGGLAPLALVLLFYWVPTTKPVTRSRRAAIVTAISFAFVLMTFTIGSIYVPGGI